MLRCMETRAPTQLDLLTTNAGEHDASGLQPRSAQPAIRPSPSPEILHTAADHLRWCAQSIICDEPDRGRACVTLARELDAMAARHGQ